MIRFPTLTAWVLALSAVSATADPADSPSDAVRQFYEMVDAAEWSDEDLLAWFAPAFVDHNRPAGFPESLADREMTLALFRALREGFPGAIHEIQILEDLSNESAIVYWTFRATHTGPFLGRPPTGKVIAINGIDIFRYAEGLFEEQWHIEELLSLFSQIDE